LPEAHVQAPTEGSVILAALLLKLGGYGFLRLIIPLAPDAMLFFSPLFLVLCICGIVCCSMSAVVQVDLKRLIAYSSIAHMNLVVLGIFSFNVQGLQGAIFLMLAHGIVSSGLFFLIGFLYDRHRTRVIFYYTGLVQPMPIFITCFFIFILANVSFPSTSNFVGELLLLIGLIQHSFLVAIMASFFLFNSIAFLEVNPYIEKYTELTRLEFHTIFFLLVLVFILGIFPNIVLDLTYYSVQNLLQFLV
jgi:NADH-quinone oxidoreductase subunit M